LIHPERWSISTSIQELIRKVQENELVPPQLRRLISPGVTVGGARPKALLNIAGEQWAMRSVRCVLWYASWLDGRNTSGRVGW